MRTSLNEKIVSIFIIASLLLLAAGLILGFLCNNSNNVLLGNIASYCLLFCVVPFMSLQFFMPAGIHVRFFSDSPLLIKIIIYLLLFPVANIWFLFWLDSFLHFIPYYTLLVVPLDEYVKALTIYNVGISFLLNGSGLLARFIKRKKTVS